MPEQAETAPTEVFEGVEIWVGHVHSQDGYVHCPTRRQVLAEALDIGIPAEVVHHRDLMTERQKPSEMGFNRAKKLIVQVRAAKASRQDLAPLWAQWMPATKKRRGT